MRPDPLRQIRIRKRLEEAAGYQIDGRFEEARAIYEDILAQDGNQADALHGMGVLCLQQNEPEQSESWLRHAAQQFPVGARIWNDLGGALRMLGRQEEAIEAYEKALSIKPDFAEALNNLGVAHFMQEDLERAELCLAEAIAASPDHPQAHNNLGVLREQQGRIEEALDCYRQAVRLKTDYQEALDNYTSLLGRHMEFLPQQVQGLIDAANEMRK